MQTVENRFWPRYFSDPTRPIDQAVRKVSPHEAVAFVKGCQRVYSLVNFLNPDVIFIPLRGAMPIDWALRELQELGNGRSPMRIYLPIGTAIDPLTGAEWGPEKLVKREIVSISVNNLRKSHSWIEKPLLLDEVQSGATITNVTHNLVRALMRNDPRENVSPLTNRLYLVAIQDSRNGWPTHQKAKGYKSIVGNSKINISAYTEEIPLFTVDRQVFLDRLLGPEGETKNHLIAPMIMPNLEAEKLIRAMVRVVNKPLLFEKELEGILITDDYSGRNLSERVDDQSVFYWFKEMAKISASKS